MLILRKCWKKKKRSIRSHSGRSKFSMSNNKSTHETDHNVRTCYFSVIAIQMYGYKRSKLPYKILLCDYNQVYWYTDTYSYFKKGYPKKCTRQSRKALWMVFSLLFLKEIRQVSSRGYGRMFASAKGKQKKQFRQLQCREQCIDRIPYYRNSRTRPLRKFEKMVVARAGRLREWALVSDRMVKQ